MTARLFSSRYSTLIPALMLTMALGQASAQTVITPDKNKYSPADDVKIGQEAAQQARQQLPMLNDSTVDNYVEPSATGSLTAIPAELQHPEFRYSFDVVNQKDINAFALAGRADVPQPRHDRSGAGRKAKSPASWRTNSPMSRCGMAPRRPPKAQKFQIGAIAGQILGAIVGGGAGNVISAGSQIGLGTYFMKYGREYERQADILGAQMMARAGYDPRRMADMFRTIESQGGGGGPEWMSITLTRVIVGCDQPKKRRCFRSAAIRKIRAPSTTCSDDCRACRRPTRPSRSREDRSGAATGRRPATAVSIRRARARTDRVDEPRQRGIPT